MTTLAQEAPLKEILCALPLSAAVVDERGKFIFYNQGWAQLAEKFPEHSILGHRHQIWLSRYRGENLKKALYSQLNEVCKKRTEQFEHVIVELLEGTPVQLTLSLTPIDYEQVTHALIVIIKCTVFGSMASDFNTNDPNLVSLLEGLQEAVVIQDPSGTIISCNKSAEKILCLSSSEMMGLDQADPQWSYIYPDYTPCPPSEVPSARAMRTGQSVTDFLMGLNWSDGRRKWLLLNSKPIFRPGEKKPYLTITSFFDMTEQKQNEEKLSDLSDRLQLALMSGGIGVWEYDPHLDSGHWDTNMLGIFGRSAAELNHDLSDWLCALHPEETSQFKVLLQEMFHQKTHLDTELRILRPTGEIRFIKIIGKKIIKTGYQHSTIIGVVLDNTKQHDYQVKLQQRSHELEQLSGRLQLAIDLEGIGIWYWNTKDDVLHWDEGMYRLYDVKPEAFTATLSSWERRVHPDDLAQAKSIMALAMSTGEKQTTEFRLIDSNDKIKYIHANVKVQKNIAGEPIIATGVNRDITLIKLAQKKLHSEREYLKNIIDKLPVGAIIVNGDSLWINDHAEKIMGYKKSEIKTLKSFFSFIKCKKPEQIAHDYKRRQKNRSFDHSELLPFIRGDGEVRWISFSASRLMWPNGGLTALRNEGHNGIIRLQYN